MSRSRILELIGNKHAVVLFYADPKEKNQTLYDQLIGQLSPLGKPETAPASWAPYFREREDVPGILLFYLCDPPTGITNLCGLKLQNKPKNWPIHLDCELPAGAKN